MGHFPLFLQISWWGGRPQEMWRLDAGYLADPDTVNYLRLSTREYLSFNGGTVDSSVDFLAAYKATLSGRALLFLSSVKRAQNKRS